MAAIIDDNWVFLDLINGSISFDQFIGNSQFQPNAQIARNFKPKMSEHTKNFVKTTFLPKQSFELTKFS